MLATQTNLSVSDTDRAKVIVSEQSGCWAAALRRALGPAVRIHETRSVVECWEDLAAAPDSLLVVEVTTGNLESFLERMARREREYPQARVAVVADRRLGTCRWLLLEAGAVLFVTSPRRLDGLAALAQRHLAAQPELAAEKTQKIWATLPWKERNAVVDSG
ncbi:MAG: hypothetical protein JW888_09320 [Pirellulales bacterium]|nr:hypothetical protein [Pirellulales bacterium]